MAGWGRGGATPACLQAGLPAPAQPRRLAATRARTPHTSVSGVSGSGAAHLPSPARPGSSASPPPSSPAGPRPNFYSHDAAPGLVLATGNVGAHLDFQAGSSCTFMSRDAGLTWEDVADYAGELLFSVLLQGRLMWG